MRVTRASIVVAGVIGAIAAGAILLARAEVAPSRLPSAPRSRDPAPVGTASPIASPAGVPPAAVPPGRGARAMRRGGSSAADDASSLAPAAPAHRAEGFAARDLGTLLARLDSLAGGAEGDAATESALILAEIRRRFTGTLVPERVAWALGRRGARLDSFREVLTDADLTAVLRRVESEAGGSAPVHEMEFLGLAGSLAARGGDSPALADSFRRSPHASVRRAAAVLAQASPDRAAILLELARDPDALVRATALHMASALIDDGAMDAALFEEAVFAALQDENEELRETAMDFLPHYGLRGATEAVRLLRTGAHRKNDDDGGRPGPLVHAALAGSPAALLADPLEPTYARDLAVGAGGVPENRPDLLRILSPHAVRISAALPPHALLDARGLFDALCAGGEYGAVRDVLHASGLPSAIRARAGAALLERAPPREWEAAVAAWACDSGIPADLRFDFLVDQGDGPQRDDPRERAEAKQSWLRVLGTVAGLSGEPRLAEAAARLLQHLAGR